EQVAAAYERHLVVRCSTLFGNVGERSRGGIVATVLQAARRTRKFHAIDDVICSPTYTNHLATAIHNLLSNRDTGIKKIANEGQATPAGLLNQLSKQTGLPLEIKPIPSSELKQTANRSPNTSITKSDITLPHWNDALREFLDSRIQQR
ncbi:MAG: sugar nucleotide-binding protein, partial [Planctomycetaceae bacterium]|nr:sugar nucleotide-binding protein [Planctomycetaceae bacterium]